MNAIAPTWLPFRPCRTACHVPSDLESVSERGDEVPAVELGLSPDAVQRVWGRVQALYRTGLYAGIQVCIRRHGGVALDGSLGEVEFRKDENFGFEVPVEVPGVAEVLLDPRRTWDDSDAYDAQAAKLVQMFADNFAQYVPFIDDDVKAAAIG